ncbi:hypothetical protein [Dyella japonica]|uniref:Uncharacterized protein n=1 Tax=Dyella japonica DSM 16301 TaxID=1440762 RepID=A0A0G9H340_9GAMM|nr:hypothetical protein [Dyella japonica]KLD63916.1 hypothetical protein Y882_09890 [Dyella japonica DSM 16301]
MAAPDHTALIRPFFAMDGTLTAPPSCPYVAGTRESMQRPLTSQDGISQVADTLANRLADSQARLHAQYLEWPTDPSRWPFPRVYADGIGTAIRHSQPYSGLLDRMPK